MPKYKKIFLGCLIVTLLGITSGIKPSVVKAEELSLLQMVEILISLDAISADKSEFAKNLAISATELGLDNIE